MGSGGGGLLPMIIWKWFLSSPHPHFPQPWHALCPQEQNAWQLSPTPASAQPGGRQLHCPGEISTFGSLQAPTLPATHPTIYGRMAPHYWLFPSLSQYHSPLLAGSTNFGNKGTVWCRVSCFLEADGGHGNKCSLPPFLRPLALLFWDQSTTGSAQFDSSQSASIPLSLCNFWVCLSSLLSQAWPLPWRPLFAIYVDSGISLNAFLLISHSALHQFWDRSVPGSPSSLLRILLYNITSSAL